MASENIRLYQIFIKSLENAYIFIAKTEYNENCKFLTTKAGRGTQKMLEKKGKKRWIIIGVAVVLIIALVIGVTAAGSFKNDTSQTTGSIEKITKRTIANSISGNGVVESADKQDVTGGSYGSKVSTVNVEVGDMVGVGDVICVFDTTDIDEQIANVQQNIVDTEADRAVQNADYDQRMVDATNDRNEQLETAIKNRDDAKAELKEAKKELKARKKKYDKAVAEAEKKGEKLSVQDETDLLSQISSQESVVDNAQTRVDNYQSQIDSLKNEDNSSIEDSKKSYNDQVDSTVESLQDQLEAYQEQKEDATIRANMSGTVTAVNVIEGTTFSGGVIATVEGLDHFIVEAQIEEYDIPDIEVGMKVLIKTDATRDLELEGVVSYIAPRATNSGDSSSALSGLMSGMDTSSMTGSSGSATYLVKIELKEQNERLRLGMNAKTSILIEERVDVWSVPYDAVYTREDGTTYLEQVTGKDEEGNLITKELDVQVGLQGTYYVEVISDLIDENTEILIPDAQGNSSIEELLNMMGADAGI